MTKVWGLMRWRIASMAIWGCWRNGYRYLFIDVLGDRGRQISCPWNSPDFWVQDSVDIFANIANSIRRGTINQHLLAHNPLTRLSEGHASQTEAWEEQAKHSSKC